MVEGYFLPGESFLHRFDPRVKLVLLVPLVASFFLPRPLALVALCIACLATVIALALGAKELWRAVRAMGMVLLLIFLLTPPFHTEGRILIRVFSITLVTTGGLREALILLLRFTGISLSFFVVFRTMELSELVLSLRWFGFPYGLSLAIAIAFRYIPALGSAYRNAVDAHKLRNGAPEAGRGRGVLKRQLPILTSVLIQAVKSIPILAMVLESRGYGRPNPRTSFEELKKGRPFIVDLIAGLLVCVALVLPSLFGWPRWLDI